jgi:hypothetical protein
VRQEQYQDWKWPNSAFGRPPDAALLRFPIRSVCDGSNNFSSLSSLLAVLYGIALLVRPKHPEKKFGFGRRGSTSTMDELIQ